jgi:prevent-host-death family protein
MRYSTRIKPISYFKANAAEILADLNDGAEPMILTQNGEAKAIVQDIHSYEQTQETLAMLKILALGMADIEAGRVRPARDVFEEIKAKRRQNNG